MRANPGGQIPPSEVVGRDDFIARLWQTIEQQSLLLSAERRMGKTCIVKKMVAEAPADRLCVFRDLEQVRTPLEFAQTVFRDVEDQLGKLKWAAEKTRQLLKELGGTEIAGVIKLPKAAGREWKALLETTLEDLVSHCDRTVIFFWDEVPLMLYNIQKRTDESTAMEMLDALRACRQMHTGLRMVFTGSIGLHNVLRSLKQAGYANDPTNDMDTIDVAPLSPDDARELAKRLLLGETLVPEDMDAATEAIAREADCVPYFIHHVVSQLAQLGHAPSPEGVADVVQTCLTDSQDSLHLAHYRDRIDIYYEQGDQPFVLGLLDVLSTTEETLHFDELFNRLKHSLATEEAERVRNVLTLLQRDHYVAQTPDGRFRFRFPLIQRWWRLSRGLSQ